METLVGCFGVVFLTLLNLRGVRESVMLWVPVFFLFVGTHALAIFIGIVSHAGDLSAVARQTAEEIGRAQGELGLLGMFVLMLKAFSLGAGTYTGIEAVSNGLPILREPRVETGKRTMTYMGVSLAITVLGLLLAYLLYAVQPVAGKTLNAVLFERITANWPAGIGPGFVTVSMLSATALLFIAAQAGFLDGPRVLANMALDRWFPTRFASLSDRFVTQNGILLMGGAALLALLLTRGAVGLLVVLYSINVFLTFCLSQLGMVRHWWRHRATAENWKRKLAVNGLGLVVTTFILLSLAVVKFHEGGWVTLVVTGAVVGFAGLVNHHYRSALADLQRLDALIPALEPEVSTAAGPGGPPPSHGRTAIVFVNGYNGLGLHTFLGILRLFPGMFGHFVFVQVGAVDAGSFKGAEELERLKRETAASAERYAGLARRHGFTAATAYDVSHDIVDTLGAISNGLLRRHPDAMLFGGQLAFSHETLWTRWLHNYVVYSLQRLFCRRGVPFVIVPARV